jgi:glycosyltransferase involved in cell wall biosynthesis
VALAERIRAACADPAMAEAAGLAGRRFAAGFDWDVLAGRQDEVYRSVLAEALR